MSITWMVKTNGSAGGLFIALPLAALPLGWLLWAPFGVPIPGPVNVAYELSYLGILLFAGLLLMGLSFVLVAGFVAGPFNGILAEVVEARLRGTRLERHETRNRLQGALEQALYDHRDAERLEAAEK